MERWVRATFSVSGGISSNYVCVCWEGGGEGGKEGGREGGEREGGRKEGRKGGGERGREQKGGRGKKVVEFDNEQELLNVLKFLLHI